jgi:hypothetical protein
LDINDMLMYHYRVLPHNMIIYPERWGSHGPGIRPGITQRNQLNDVPRAGGAWDPWDPWDGKKISSTVKTIRVVEVR